MAESGPAGHSWSSPFDVLVPSAAERDGAEDGVEHRFQPADDILRQHADDQVTVLLKLEVLAAVAAIGFGILEVVVAVDLDDKAQRFGGEVGLDLPARPEWKPERRVEPEEPGGLREPLQALVQEPLRRAAARSIGSGPADARAASIARAASWKNGASSGDRATRPGWAAGRGPAPAVAGRWMTDSRSRARARDSGACSW